MMGERRRHMGGDGPALRELRLARLGTNSLTECARASGVSPTLLSLIENGKRRLTVGVAAQLARALGPEVATLARPGALPRAEAAERRADKWRGVADRLYHCADRMAEQDSWIASDCGLPALRDEYDAAVEEETN